MRLVVVDCTRGGWDVVLVILKQFSGKGLGTRICDIGHRNS